MTEDQINAEAQRIVDSFVGCADTPALRRAIQDHVEQFVAETFPEADAVTTVDFVGGRLYVTVRDRDDSLSAGGA